MNYKVIFSICFLLKLMPIFNLLRSPQTSDFRAKTWGGHFQLTSHFPILKSSNNLGAFLSSAPLGHLYVSHYIPLDGHYTFCSPTIHCYVNKLLPNFEDKFRLLQYRKTLQFPLPKLRHLGDDHHRLHHQLRKHHKKWHTKNLHDLLESCIGSKGYA